MDKSPLSITAHEAIPKPDALVVDEGLGDANDRAAPYLSEVRPLACFARQAGGRVVGGAVGRTWGRCAELQQLWVDEAHRGEGVGTRLLERFHADAGARGVRLFYLDTWTFQARPFYERLGYRVRLAIGGMRAGVEKYTMVRESSAWLDVPLADYEGHMALPAIGQAAMLAEALAARLEALRPASLAVVGCAGGNGFERIDPSVTRRVVAIDVNPAFTEALRARHAARIPGLEIRAGDFRDLQPEPVDLVMAALVLEYVDPVSALPALEALVKPGGWLVVVLQRPSEGIPAVSPSPFASLAVLGAEFGFVDPVALVRDARGAGLRFEGERTRESSGGKRFAELAFRRTA
ncbi:MAG: GNAT family N-acetyltransferase [Betaproteobacteria bacterium]|nr:GNAT family N-acetyltransferase [Betaproteobacteria bacterium]